MLLIRIGLNTLLLTSFLAVSCTPPAPDTIIAKAEVRYLADQQQLSADLQLFKGDSFTVSRPYVPPPTAVTFLGSLMEQRNMRGDNFFRAVRNVALPEELRFSFPMDSLDKRSTTTLYFNIPPLSADKLPTIISKGAKRTTFSIGTEPLREKESLIVFFEPEDRAQRPRRVVVAGPSSTESISIPTAAMAEIPFGQYSMYLVRQGIIESGEDGIIRSITYQHHSRSQAVNIAE